MEKVLENLRVGFGLRVFYLQDVTRSGLGDGSCLWEVWGLSKSRMRGSWWSLGDTQKDKNSSIPCTDTKPQQSPDLAIPSIGWLLSPSLGWHLEA